MGNVVFVRKLQQNLSNITEKSEGIASGESRILTRTSLATGLVFKRFRLLSTMHDRNRQREKYEKETRIRCRRWLSMFLWR